MQLYRRGIDLLLICLIFLACASLGVASSPASFCKCTCFSNSTIIPLDPEKSNSVSTQSSLFRLRSHDDAEDFLDRRAKNYRSLSCNDCNRKFCLDYDLPTCKGAKEEDVFTTCFQRDSRKDQAIVFIFIIATGSLLAWAIMKPWIGKWLEVRTAVCLLMASWTLAILTHPRLQESDDHIYLYRGMQVISWFHVASSFYQINIISTSDAKHNATGSSESPTDRVILAP